ncbi:MAG: PAS domain-containing protein [Hyphomonadaceae bacterium]
MEAINVHPNTRVVLDAWKRLSDGSQANEGPATDDDASLVGSMFVLNHVSERDFAFRRAGASIERLFGRQLTDHNFLSIWSEADRHLVAAGLAVAVEDSGATLIHARGETLAGKRVDLEFSLAPLVREDRASVRFLGLCQTITPEEVLNGRPVSRLQALAIYPPAPDREAAIRLVVSR